MKTLILLSLMVSASMAMASDPVSCIKAAETDPAVLAANKAYDQADVNRDIEIESLAIRLCSVASDSKDPISCLKTAVSDPTVLSAYKAYDKTDVNKNLDIENLAINLCGGPVLPAK